MQRTKPPSTQSLSYTDFEQQQQRKQILHIIFPGMLNNSEENLERLQQNLEEVYNHLEHKEQLINYAYRNHNFKNVHIYRKFIKDQHPEVLQPNISLYYKNYTFPNLLTLGEYSTKHSQYPQKHIQPLNQSFFNQLDSIFQEYGFIPNLERFLTFYPQYLQKQRIVEKQLFQNSKIDQQTTYFLGLCAAAQNGCPYMINRMAIKFLSKGGKIEWIKEKKYSVKIKKAIQLNRVLTRSIWEIQGEHFSKIIQDGHWNMNQIALILQIFTYINSLCVITLALGLQSEQYNSILMTKQIEQHLKNYQSIIVQSIFKGKKVTFKQIIPTLKNLLQEVRSASDIIQSKPNPKKSFHKQKQKQKENKSTDDEPIELYMKQIGNELTEQKLVIKVMKEIQILPQFTPIQKRRDTKYNQFTCIEYNFEMKTFPRLLSMSTVSESTKKIRALIKQAENMGVQNYENAIISSSKQLRKALRYYAENLCGFSHPEYDYKKFMTKILTIPLKFYVRILMLSPLHMKRQIIDEIMHEEGQIELFDLGHTAILIAMAKLKLSLTLSTYYFDN